MTNIVLEINKTIQSLSSIQDKLYDNENYSQEQQTLSMDDLYQAKKVLRQVRDRFSKGKL